MKRAQCLTFLLLVIGAGGVEKIRIDPATRLYRGAQDGRVYMFHGLDTENSSPPWTLRTLDEEQIQLMKTVKWLVHVVEPQSSFLHPSFLSSFCSLSPAKRCPDDPFPMIPTPSPLPFFIISAVGPQCGSCWLPVAYGGT